MLRTVKIVQNCGFADRFMLSVSKDSTLEEHLNGNRNIPVEKMGTVSVKAVCIHVNLFYFPFSVCKVSICHEN